MVQRNLILNTNSLIFRTDSFSGLRTEKLKTYKIIHTPNHRGVKGTEFIINAVQRLQKEGYRLELVLIENKSNDEVHRIMSLEADILIEQLNGYGYALSGLECMACGIPVISSPQDDDYMELLRTMSFFDECPLIGSSPTLIYHDLKALLDNPSLMVELGEAGQKFVKKYHSYEAARFFFGEIIKKLYDNEYQIINMFHPLIGSYKASESKIRTSLIKNRIS